MPPVLRGFAAHASHVLLYILMFAQPLVGRAMLSAAGDPIVLIGAWHLPPILPHSTDLTRCCGRYIPCCLRAVRHFPRPSRRGACPRPDLP
jgi:cytochrome b561